MIVEDHDMSDRCFAFDDGSRRDHEDSLLSQRCGIRKAVGSNLHHSFLKRSKIDISQNIEELLNRGYWRAEDRAIASSKGHGHPGKKYIGPVFMFGYTSGNRIPDMLIAWNESDRWSDGEIVENFHSFFVVN